MNDSDQELGRRLARILEARRPVTLRVTMSIVEDLMAADVSLMPALQILSSHPIFLQFINATQDSFLLPLKDSLIAAAEDTLAPPLVCRVHSFLSGYMGTSTPPKRVDVPTESSRPQASFPGFVQAGEAGFPATEIAAHNQSDQVLDNPEPTLLSAPENIQPPAGPAAETRGSASQSTGEVAWLRSVSPWTGIPLLIVIGWFVLFKIPAVCNAFDLCSDTPKSKPQENKPAKQPATAAPDRRPVGDSRPPAQAVPEPLPQPAPAVTPRNEPPAPRELPPPAYQPPPSSTVESHQPSSSAPLRDEPLW